MPCEPGRMSGNSPGVMGRLVGASFALLTAAIAVYVAVRLIESVAAALIVIAAVIGVLGLIGLVIRVLWQRHRMDRW